MCALLLAPLPLSLPVLDSCTQLPALLLRRLFKHAKVCGSDSEGEQIADRENSLIRRVSVPDGVVTTIAGVGSKGYTDGAAGQLWQMRDGGRRKEAKEGLAERDFAACSIWIGVCCSMIVVAEGDPSHPSAPRI